MPLAELEIHSMKCLKKHPNQTEKRWILAEHKKKIIILNIFCQLSIISVEHIENTLEITLKILSINI